MNDNEDNIASRIKEVGQRFFSRTACAKREKFFAEGKKYVAEHIKKIESYKGFFERSSL